MIDPKKKPAPPGVFRLEGDDSPDRLGRPVWVAVDTNGEQIATAVVTDAVDDVVVRAALIHLLARQDPDVDTSDRRPVGGDPMH